jgi:hypothetical protein
MAFRYGNIQKSRGFPRLFQLLRFRCLRSRSAVLTWGRSTTVFLGAEALETEDRSAALGLGARLERDLACLAAACTRCRVHLALGHAVILPLVATVLAPLW